MARRTKEDAQKTREQLLDAAETVFHRKGVSKTSLNDIAEEAGLTRGALYWHFKNKHDVFEAMLERMDLPLEILHQAIASPEQEDPLGEMRKFLYYLMGEIANDPKRRRVYEIVLQKCELSEENASLAERHRQGFVTASERMSRILNNAIHRQQLPADLDVERAVLFLHVQITGLIYMWLLRQGDFDFETEGRRVIDTYFCILHRGFGEKNDG
ncbi:TetR family transcriptional regulator [Marinobacter xestospongiae]|uniref:TetR family transcriptional regulator n=1 Tax=Marinobacter xestospongiae TaxID=994319 RepID=UPI00200621BE|nr:TetR family transcriptional regulator [Marinobacter xestospongiae]MCK7565476.1 TetR family transcriptional regulator [Marinobacter xestospongiae]